MDNLKPYAKYKASGVDWLGDIPKGWKVKRVGIGYNITLGKMLQPMPKSDNDISVPYYRALNVQWEKITNDVKEMWASPEEVRFFSIEKEDLLVCEGGEVGRASIVNSISNTIIFQNALHRVRAKKGFSVEFLLRVLEHVAYSDWFSVLCNKATIAHFTSDKFKSLICAFPPLPEQQAIANFLDQNCARIDSLIKKKQQFLELLEEKRRTLITHAVTRGLDASAPFKVSGVDWLGDIPKGWKVISLRRLFCVKSGDTTPPNDIIESGYQVFGGNGFRGYIDKWNTDKNTIIIGRYGALCGNVKISPDKIWATEHAFRVFPYLTYNTRFMVYLLEHLNLNRLSARAAQPGLNSDLVRRHQVALPNEVEQQAIVDYLDTETVAIDKQKKHVQTSIELLKEYRASLITHAVTGKIDVRDMVTQ